jgi:hypothetical protein
MTANLILGALGGALVYLCISVRVAVLFGRVAAAADAVQPEPDEWDADWLPGWLTDIPTVPLTQGEMDRFEDIVRGAAA